MAKKVLIVYYSWSGVTEKLANKIAQAIPESTQLKLTVPDKTFSSDMYETFDISKEQIAQNNYPKIQSLSIDVNDFDLILVGSPVWGGKPATPIYTFLNEIQDFKGEVASFYTDAGTVGDYAKVFKSWAKELNVVGVFAQASQVVDLARK